MRTAILGAVAALGLSAGAASAQPGFGYGGFAPVVRQQSNFSFGFSYNSFGGFPGYGYGRPVYGFPGYGYGRPGYGYGFPGYGYGRPYYRGF